MKRTRIFFFVSLLTGCAGLIGVPDLTFDVDAPQGSPDGAASDGKSGGDGDPANGDGGDATIPCDETKLQTDMANCGRCGHDCLGAACNAGKCEPVTIGTVANAPLASIVEHDNALYVSTVISFTTESGGIWKAPKTSGNPVPYVTLRYAQDMAVLGDTLYFVVSDDALDDAGKEGGLWSCDLNGPTPCVPKLIARAQLPRSVAVDNGKVYYTDETPGKGLMQYAPPGPPVVFRSDFNPPNLWIDKEAAFYVVSLGFNPNQERAVLFEIPPDAGDPIELSLYQKPNARAGRLRGSANALYFTAYDYETTTGGIVRRVSRPGTPGVAPCDYGTITNKRPGGIYIDATRIYWANQGDFAAPYANGSIAYCDLDSCCTAPTQHWTGDGEPYGITGDDKGLYWVTYRTGAIWKIAKP